MQIVREKCSSFQIISKLAEATSIGDLFKGRSLNANSVIEFAEIAFDAIKKFEDIDQVSTS